MNEGLDNSRDVAGNNAAHPWEAVPEGVSPSKKGGKLKLTPKIITISSAIIIVVAIGVFFLVRFFVSLGSNDGGVNGTVIPLAIDNDVTIESSTSPEQVYELITQTLDNVLADGILDGEIPDTAKMEDNFNVFLLKVSSDYDKTLYRLYFISKIALLGNTDRAAHLLQTFEEEKRELDKNQRYMYLTAYANYYAILEDETNKSKYINLLESEFPPEDIYYDIDTGEIITDSELIKKINFDFEDQRTTENNSEGEGE
ncbi:hypothetical protein IJI76_03085 [Candidatus Saccharibacteria bacterium]|nr:hypothetical protein [Candidatus Saccharibacteria bacterium]